MRLLNKMINPHYYDMYPLSKSDICALPVPQYPYHCNTVCVHPMQLRAYEEALTCR